MLSIGLEGSCVYWAVLVDDDGLAGVHTIRTTVTLDESSFWVTQELGISASGH